MLKQKPSTYLVFFLSLALYIAVGYCVQRYQTLPLFLCYFAVFCLYLGILKTGDYRFWIVASIVFRAVLLFSIPALSDDFYRFIWDGRLLAAGIHPFAHVPSFYMSVEHSIPGLDAELFSKLNSKETFTVYPPVAQLISFLAVKFSDGSVPGTTIAMRIIIFCFELGTLWIFPRIIRRFNLPRNSVLIYALNPLVILELTGNLHHEGVMIFFLLAGILFLRQNRYSMSAIAWGFSVCAKLIPLLFLPLLVRYIGWKKSVIFWIVTASCCVILFAPLLNPDIIRLMTSIGYYFQRFEFNASLYYLVRAAGYLVAGFNIIYIAGPLLGVIAAGTILNIAFAKLRSVPEVDITNDLFIRMMWCLLTWFLCTTILHPWYIITLLAISVLTPYRFTVVWTAMIFLTYQGYTKEGFHENLFLIALEYVVVIAYLLYEIVWTKRHSLS
ncbi:MAG TPA: hypothetical protein VFI14_06975 [Chryseosolibacter sp.]|nr:hypothetical protein [Chryseosolibacter sp.]